MRKALFLLPVLLFLTLAGYFALALRPDHDPNLLPSALIDKPAPAFDLASLNGGTNVSAAGLKGQVVVVNFFASWCVPCRVEHPILMRLASKEHLPIYGIAYKDREAASQVLLSQLGDPYRRIGVDSDGRVGLDFGVYGVPETYVIDKSGHIRRRFVGPLTAETIENDLLPLMRKLEAS
jgi:cytochrome c biogenesis protein CcmG/thiol:disulfide interchange protein DsbE